MPVRGGTGRWAGSSIRDRRLGKFDETRQSGENKRVVPTWSGPVAQLGARFHGMEEVIGSIPIRSTKSLKN